MKLYQFVFLKKKNIFDYFIIIYLKKLCNLVLEFKLFYNGFQQFFNQTSLFLITVVIAIAL